MRIMDLNPENERLYCMCLEDWSDEMKEAGDHKWNWYQKMKERGLRVKLALDAEGLVGGMIQYAPIEHSFVEGAGLYFVYCIWVHGYKKGRGNFQKRGMGKALLQAAEEDARALGAQGMAAWGLSLPVFMRASWFRKQGYVKVDKLDMQALLWKPFSQEAKKPKWIVPQKKPELMQGKVKVTALLNGWCPAMALAYERAKRAVAEFGGKAEFSAIDTFDRECFLDWGVSDALFVDGKQIRTGPPPSYKKIYRAIAKRVKKLRD